MAIAVSQTVIGTAASQASIALGSWTPAANDLVLLAVLTRGVSVTHSSVSGNGLTWTQIGASVDGSTNIRASLWKGVGASPTTGQITVTLSAAPATALALASRFSGVNTTTPVEANTSANNALSSTPSVSVTTITANAWAFGAHYDRGSTFTVGSGKSAISINNVTGTSGNILNISTEQLLMASPGAATLDGTWSAAVSWAAIAASIKPAAGGAPPDGRSTRQIASGAAIMISGG